jgi:integration host factor subunit beta
MNRNDLIDALANDVEIKQHEAKAIIKTILERMTSALVCGESIEIRGFGSFTVRQYKSYEGCKPKTGEKTFIKPKKLPFSKPGKEVKVQVNENRKS